MEFTLTVNATPQKLWDVLWTDANYRAWTSAFLEGSRAESDWKEGSKILFLNNENDGMVSVIAKNRPYEFMSFKHVGTVSKGKESVENSWTNAYENYTLTTQNGQTTLDVELTGVPEEFKEYFNATWPAALDKIKELAERP